MSWTQTDCKGLTGGIIDRLVKEAIFCVFRFLFGGLNRTELGELFVCIFGSGFQVLAGEVAI